MSALIISGEEGLGHKSVDEIVAQLDKTWSTHAHANRAPGEPRGEVPNPGDPDSYTADMAAMFGKARMDPRIVVRNIRDCLRVLFALPSSAVSRDSLPR